MAGPCVLAGNFCSQSHRRELKLSHFQHSSNQPIQSNAPERQKIVISLSPSYSCKAGAGNIAIEPGNEAANRVSQCCCLFAYFCIFAVSCCCYICLLLVSITRSTLRYDAQLLVPTDFHCLVLVDTIC